MMRKVLWMVALVLVGLYGCSGDIEPGRREGEPQTIKGLTTAEVAASLLAGSEVFVGTVESADRGMLTARIDGRVQRILVNEGDTVASGELLLTIEDNVAGDRLDEAEGNRQSAEARFQLAEKTWNRYQQLFAKEAVTPQEMDRVNADLEMARQQLKAAEAGVSAARTALSYTRVTAPYAAKVVRKEVREGSTVLPGTPLLALDRAGRRQVRADISEAWAGKIKPGMPLTVDIPALNKRYDARVSEVLPASDPRSRSFQITLDLPADPDLSAGLFARVFVGEPEVPTLLVPTTALVNRGQLHGIYTVDTDNILHYRLVRIGRQHGDQVEILAGLEAGESYVVAGAERAVNGARLEE